jgi:N-acetyl-1-D-myo-inositol-2-amino-2-deoxy-alpha-D-glucopyranoside deacetylase
MTALGVRDHRFLDTVDVPGLAPARYRDSGMAWDADHRAVAGPDTGPHAFARADAEGAAARVAAVVREVRPHVVVTYEPGGGYGHPDHVQAHRVTMRGVELAAGDGPGGDGWTVPKVYWNVLPDTLVRSALRELVAAGAAPPGWSPDGPLPSMVVPDDQVTTVVDAQAFVPAKRAALVAHATQVALDGDSVLVGDGARQPLVGVEFYRLVAGSPAGARDAEGRETDLFAGVV